MGQSVGIGARGSRKVSISCSSNSQVALISRRTLKTNPKPGRLRSSRNTSGVSSVKNSDIHIDSVESTLLGISLMSLAALRSTYGSLKKIIVHNFLSGRTCQRYLGSQILWLWQSVCLRPLDFFKPVNRNDNTTLEPLFSVCRSLIRWPVWLNFLCCANYNGVSGVVRRKSTHARLKCEQGLCNLFAA